MRIVDKDTARRYSKLHNKDGLALEFMSYAFCRGAGWVTKDKVIIHPIEYPKGTVKITLLITENTTIKQIEKSWQEIKKWREVLIEWQGQIPLNAEQKFSASLQEALLNGKDHGRSYLQLAKWVNELIIEQLTEYVGWLSDSAEYRKWQEEWFEISIRRDPPDIPPKMRSWLKDYWARPDHKKSSSLRTANLILKFCRPRLSEQNRGELLEEAFTNIQKGKQPFVPNEPVRQTDIRERIDYWRTKQKGVGNLS